jgi:hypothetical protein
MNVSKSFESEYVRIMGTFGANETCVRSNLGEFSDPQFILSVCEGNGSSYAEYQQDSSSYDSSSYDSSYDSGMDSGAYGDSGYDSGAYGDSGYDSGSYNDSSYDSGSYGDSASFSPSSYNSSAYAEIASSATDLHIHWPEGACWKGNFCLQEIWVSGMIPESAINAGRAHFKAHGWTCSVIDHCAGRGFKGPAGSGGKGAFEIRVWTK